MKIVGIGGEPATGKSSLMRSIICALFPAGPFQMERLQEHRFKYASCLYGYIVLPRKFMIFGLYDGTKPFEGTDRLSMAVQDSVEMFLNYAHQSPLYKDFTVLFEGDRLFNSRTLRKAPKYGDCLWIILEASEAEKERRHRFRRDNQKQPFLQSRRTKLCRLVREFQQVEMHPNQSPQDQLAVLERILAFVRPAEKCPPAPCSSEPGHSV